MSTVGDELASMTSEQIKNLSPEKRAELQARLDTESAEIQKRAIAANMALHTERAREAAIVDRAKLEGKFPTGPYLGRFYYPDGETPQLRKDIVGVETSNEVFEFYTPEFKELPALPLKGTGSSWSEGWDIPTRWAVDALGVTWADNAHGHPLEVIERHYLFAMLEKEPHALARIHVYFDLKPPMPEWAKTALASGWTPPPGFDPSSYHKE